MSQISEPLNSTHKKSDFSCGKEMLDTYIQKQANQDVKRKLSACFVINETETNLIKGYYWSSDCRKSETIGKSPFKYSLSGCTIMKSSTYLP